jgi:hypothetical protein
VSAADLLLLFAFMDVKADPATMKDQNTAGEALLACEDESEIADVTGMATSYSFYFSLVGDIDSSFPRHRRGGGRQPSLAHGQQPS